MSLRICTHKTRTLSGGHDIVSIKITSQLWFFYSVNNRFHKTETLCTVTAIDIQILEDLSNFVIDSEQIIYRIFRTISCTVFS